MSVTFWCGGWVEVDRHPVRSDRLSFGRDGNENPEVHRTRPAVIVDCRPMTDDDVTTNAARSAECAVGPTPSLVVTELQRGAADRCTSDASTNERWEATPEEAAEADAWVERLRSQCRGFDVPAEALTMTDAELHDRIHHGDLHTLIEDE